MTANVSVIIAERENSLKIPNAALRFRPPEPLTPNQTNTASPQMAASGAGPRAGGGERRGGGEGRGGGRQGGIGQGGRGGGGRGGGGGARAFGNRSQGDRPSTRTVYTLKPGKDAEHPELTPVTIRTGINDGVNTEVVDGLNEGDQVVIGLLMQDNETSSQQRPVNPFSGRGRRGF
jgi:HlyD family secretion protein